jgi:hypothetical protein
VTVVYQNNYCVSGHYHRPVFLFKTHKVSETEFCCCWCPEIGTSSIDWAQLSRFHLKTETESSLRNAVFLNETGRWIMSRNIIYVVNNVFKSMWKQSVFACFIILNQKFSEWTEENHENIRSLQLVPRSRFEPWQLRSVTATGKNGWHVEMSAWNRYISVYENTALEDEEADSVRSQRMSCAPPFISYRYKITWYTNWVWFM